MAVTDHIVWDDTIHVTAGMGYRTCHNERAEVYGDMSARKSPCMGFGDFI